MKREISTVEKSKATPDGGAAQTRAPGDTAPADAGLGSDWDAEGVGESGVSRTAEAVASAGNDEAEIPAALQHVAQSESEKLRAGGVQIGQVIAEKYRVERVLGMGGMGLVVAATHLQLGREVAVKLMRPDILGEDSAVQRALGEAQAAARIGSEHVTRVIDVGTLDGGKPYIVMEYLAGEDLANILARGPLSVAESVDYTLQACEALAEAHLQGIVHCDLKPGNLFVSRLADGSDCIKVMDFGIAKRSGPEGVSTGLTSHAGVVGSAHYMSPEQMQGRPVDPRADIWSLGTLLYEMVTGRQTFSGDTWPEVCSKVFEGTATALHEWDARIVPEFESVVARCLMRNPAERYQTVGELAEALEPFASDAGRISCGRVLRVLGGGVADSARAPQGLRTGVGERAGRDRRPLWLGLALVGLCLVAGLTLLLRQADNSSPDWPAQTTATSRPASQRPGVVGEPGEPPGSTPKPGALGAAGDAEQAALAVPTLAVPARAVPTLDKEPQPRPASADPPVGADTVPETTVQKAVATPSQATPSQATQSQATQSQATQSHAKKLQGSRRRDTRARATPSLRRKPRKPASRRAVSKKPKPRPRPVPSESKPGDAWDPGNYGPRK